MKVRSLMIGFALGIVATLAGGAAFTQKQHGAAMQQPTPEEMQKMMQAWAETIEPREEHARMAEWAGQYDTITRMWMMGPDQPPTETKGTSEMKSILGGRFIQQVDHSETLLPNPKTGMPEPTPMDGMGLFGYDNYQRMYVGCWASSSATQLLYLRGTMSPDGRKLTMYAEMDEPMLSIRGRLIKCVTEYVDRDMQIFRVYDLAAGDDYKVFEIEYTRRR